MQNSNTETKKTLSERINEMKNISQDERTDILYCAIRAVVEKEGVSFLSGFVEVHISSKYRITKKTE